MYTIKQASLRSGVGIPLLRAWERRYGVVTPVRTSSGYRLYDEEAIERLRAMRQLVEAGWSPREAAPHVKAADLDQLRMVETEAVIAPGAARDDGDEAARLISRIVDAAGTMNQEALEQALDSAFASARFEAAVQRVVFPALVEVGGAWARGELDVGAEHAAAAAVLRRFGSAFQAAGNPAGGPTVLVGLPPGGHHELALLAFATAARRAGVDVVYLGPDVPVDSWLTSVRDTSASGVVLGAAMLRDTDAVTSVFRELSRVAGGVLRAVGGRYADSVAPEGQLTLPDDLRDAVAVLRGALGNRTEAPAG